MPCGYRPLVITAGVFQCWRLANIVKNGEHVQVWAQNAAFIWSAEVDRHRLGSTWFSMRDIADAKASLCAEAASFAPSTTRSCAGCTWAPSVPS